MSWSGQIALGIGEDHVADRLVIFDVAGAAADVSVERLSNRLFERGTRHRFFRQTLQQDLGFVQEAGRAVATLEREIVNEGLLKRGELAILRVPLDGADRLAVATGRRDDAGRARIAGAVRVIDDDSRLSRCVISRGYYENEKDLRITCAGSLAADAPPPRAAPAPINKRGDRDGGAGPAAPGSPPARRSSSQLHPGPRRPAGLRNANAAASATLLLFACVKASSNTFNSVQKYQNTLKKSATQRRYFTTN